MWPLTSTSTAVALVWTVALEMALAFRLGLESRMGPLWTAELTVDSETTVSGSHCEAFTSDSAVVVVVEVDIERTGGDPCCCSCDEPNPSLSVPFSSP